MGNVILGAVILGAVITLVAVLIGYAITHRNEPDDGFKLLLEEIRKLQPEPITVLLRPLHCFHCPYKTTPSNNLELMQLEMDHHVSTVHKEEDRDGHSDIHS